MRHALRAAAVLGAILWASVAWGQAGPIAPERPAAPSFSGEWTSTFGPLTLRQAGQAVEGTYWEGGRSTLSGTVTGTRLTFRYTEADAKGEGWFELAPDGASFAGRWRPDGETEWQPWTGKRAAKAPPRGPFEGLFEATEGRIRLFQPAGGSVRGVYAFEGSQGTLEGTVTGTTLRFAWREGESAGDGEYTLAADRGSLRGRWRSEGSGADGWKAWNAKRVKPKPGVVWLTVLEAHWERDLTEQEYSFGAMLRAYLRRFPHVEVRQRRFGDRPDLERELHELAFLAEPAVLLIASHGVRGKLQANAESIDPRALIGRAVRDAPAVQLVHFSSCEMLVDGVAAGIQAEIPGRRVPISGYAVSVDWSASAVLELLYMDLVLGRRLPPARAAEILRRELRFAGDTPAAPLGAASFRFVP